MLPFYVYILQCKDRSYYTGHTDNLEKRLSEHQFGNHPCYTLNRRPIALVFCQEFGTRDEAILAEQQIKGWSRKKKEALIQGDWKKLSELSKCYADK
jgi:predicted GIY-YIG superfamily endonuclease